MYSRTEIQFTIIYFAIAIPKHINSIPLSDQQLAIRQQPNLNSQSRLINSQINYQNLWKRYDTKSEGSRDEFTVWIIDNHVMLIIAIIGVVLLFITIIIMIIIYNRKRKELDHTSNNSQISANHDPVNKTKQADFGIFYENPLYKD